MKDLTNVTVILDRSGSMSYDSSQTVKGFNDFIKSQQEGEGEVTISLLQFADECVTSYTNTPVKEARQLVNCTIKGYTNVSNLLTRSINDTFNKPNVAMPSALSTGIAYEANGRSTSLRDTVGFVIDSLGQELNNTQECDRPNKVIVVIITDGLDNSSSMYSLTKLKEMIERQQDIYNWTFLYLGANINCVSEAKSMGISVNTVASYQGTENISRGYTGASAFTSNLRSRSADSKSFDLQRLVDNKET